MSNQGTANFYQGNFKKDGLKNRGWFVGTFMEGLQKTKLVEIKYYGAEAQGNHLTKKSKTLELTFVVKGYQRGTVLDHEVEIRAGEYIIISPQVKNNLIVDCSDDLEAFTIKAPSDPSAKSIVK